MASSRERRKTAPPILLLVLGLIACAGAPEPRWEEGAPTRDELRADLAGTRSVLLRTAAGEVFQAPVLATDADSFTVGEKTPRGDEGPPGPRHRYAYAEVSATALPPVQGNSARAFVLGGLVVVGALAVWALVAAFPPSTR